MRMAMHFMMERGQGGVKAQNVSRYLTYQADPNYERMHAFLRKSGMNTAGAPGQGGRGVTGDSAQRGRGGFRGRGRGRGAPTGGTTAGQRPGGQA